MEFKKFLTPWNWFKNEEEQKTIRPHHSIGTLPVHHPLVRLQHEIDQLFDHFFQGFPSPQFGKPVERLMGSQIFPQLNIAEHATDYTITMEIPGVEENDIELTIDEGTLIIRGEKRYEQEQNNHNYHRVERSYGSFQRVLSLPADANEAQIAAKFNNGVLTITVDKNPTTRTRGRKIALS